MSFPSKSDREKCWNSRDALWECLDKAAASVGGGGSSKGRNGDAEIDAQHMATVCSQFRVAYESSCPKQWIKHFDRKRAYLKFKDKIQKDGYEPPIEKLTS